MDIINLIGGLLYQWDTGRKVKIESPSCINVDEVHFTNDMQDALVVEPKSADNVYYAEIPNILLQEKRNIKVYVVMHTENGERTVCSRGLTVNSRQKPADYIYTETEVKSYEKLDQRIKALEETAVLTAPQNLTDNEKVQARANIDAIGAPQTAEVGQFIKVTEVDENGKPIAWEAGNPDWEQMENKPFHKEECVLTFLEPTDVTFDGYWVYSERIVDTVYTREELLKKVYKVVWDGVEYDNLTAATVAGKDNRVEIGDSDNYPFAIWVYVDNTVGIHLNDGSSTTHSVALYMYDTVITKIPDEFLPDADEEISKTSKRPVQNFAVANALENVSWNALQDKPFGEIDVEDIGYLMEPVELDFSGKNKENSLTIRALSSKVVGDTIYVSWNGECYPVVLSNGILGKHHGGNPYLYDPKAYDDTGEPFFFYTVRNNIYYVYSSEKTIVTFGIANGFFGIAKLAEEYIPATQVDFEQNDESARDYVKGRTHHKEVSSFVSPTPEYEVTNKNSQFVKCGDNLPSKEDLIGALVFLDTTDGAMNYTISESDITENDWGIDFGYGYVVTSAPATIGDYTYDSTGVYLGWGLYELRTGMYRPYYRTYEMHITKYHTLDEAYIPSTIARTADVTAGLAGKVDVPQAATVGQVISVKAVDESGKPTEWECVDMVSGGSEWKKIATIELTEAVSTIDITHDVNGTPLEELGYNEIVGMAVIEGVEGNSALWARMGIVYRMCQNPTTNYITGGTANSSVNGGMISSGRKRLNFIIKVIGNRVFFTDNDISTLKSNDTGWFEYFIGYNQYMNLLSIKFYGHVATDVFGIGSEFEVWGR